MCQRGQLCLFKLLVCLAFPLVIDFGIPWSRICFLKIHTYTIFLSAGKDYKLYISVNSSLPCFNVNLCLLLVSAINEPSLCIRKGQ